MKTIGLDEDLIRRYVKYQEEEEGKAEQDRQDYTSLGGSVIKATFFDSGGLQDKKLADLFLEES